MSYRVPAYADISHFRAPYKNSLMGLGAAAYSASSASSASTVTPQPSVAEARPAPASYQAVPSASKGNPGTVAIPPRPAMSKADVKSNVAYLVNLLNFEANVSLLGKDPYYWPTNQKALEDIWSSRAGSMSPFSSDGKASPSDVKRASSDPKFAQALSLKLDKWPTKTALLLDANSSFRKQFRAFLLNLMKKYEKKSSAAVSSSLFSQLRDLGKVEYSSGGKVDYWTQSAAAAVNFALQADYTSASKSEAVMRNWSAIQAQKAAAAKASFAMAARKLAAERTAARAAAAKAAAKAAATDAAAKEAAAKASADATSAAAAADAAKAAQVAAADKAAAADAAAKAAAVDKAASEAEARLEEAKRTGPIADEYMDDEYGPPVGPILPPVGPILPPPSRDIPPEPEPVRAGMGDGAKIGLGVAAALVLGAVLYSANSKKAS